jgi:hypothetical protein
MLMHWADAQRIIDTHLLVPRAVSKYVLNCIRSNQAPDPEKLAGVLSIEEIETLQRAYRDKLSTQPELDAGAGGDQPRNLVFYHIIKDKLPDFQWEVRPEKSKPEKVHVDFRAPFVEGVRPTLASMLLRLVNKDADTELHARYRCIHQVPSAVTRPLARLFLEGNIVWPDESGMERLLNWLKLGLTNEPLTIVTPLCPDYEAEKVTGQFFRYTFDKLGSGIGVSGTRYLRTLPLLHATFAEIGVPVHFVAGLGDFEAFSAQNCARLNITEAEFIACLHGSAKALQAASPIPIETTLFTSLCGGKETWSSIYAPIRRRIENSDYGHSGVDDAKASAIAASRRQLYKRWYGELGDEAKYVKVLKAQAAEYAAMGHVVQNFVRHGLVLGADHARMAPFYNLSGPMPVMYLRNNYLGVR